MGLYDTIRIEGKQETREGRVNCWGEDMKLLVLGDKVPDIDGEYSYLLAMREGGFVIVFKNMITGWEDEIPEDCKGWPMFDKWGSRVTEQDLSAEIHGLLGNERYFFH